jgi:hypothetical protein
VFLSVTHCLASPVDVLCYLARVTVGEGEGEGGGGGEGTVTQITGVHGSTMSLVVGVLERPLDDSHPCNCASSSIEHTAATVNRNVLNERVSWVMLFSAGNCVCL